MTERRTAPHIYPDIAYTHNRTCDTYLTVGGILAKLNGEWYDCVIYKNQQGQEFVRTIDDFKKSFTRVVTSDD